MSEGFPVIVKMAVPPAADYHSGASIIVQGNTLQGVADLIGGFVGEAEVGTTLVRDIIEFNLKGAVENVLKAEPAPAAAEAAPADEDAPKLASAGMKKVVAKKLGITVEELEAQHPGLTHDEAARLRKEGK